ncbi:hypothetical protein VNO78_12765 [Psophocarpus tetragonolobus]|uniref:Uncharacterized protein n=1 Tax=Psophocarpus tetragonolobus TaxID=3891 RepID=A0AAN9XPH0_PSOTE
MEEGNGVKGDLVMTVAGKCKRMEWEKGSMRGSHVGRKKRQDKFLSMTLEVYIWVTSEVYAFESVFTSKVFVARLREMLDWVMLESCLREDRVFMRAREGNNYGGLRFQKIQKDVANTKATKEGARLYAKLFGKKSKAPKVGKENKKKVKKVEKLVIAKHVETIEVDVSTSVQGDNVEEVFVGRKGKIVYQYHKEIVKQLDYCSVTLKAPPLWNAELKGVDFTNFDKLLSKHLPFGISRESGNLGFESEVVVVEVKNKIDALVEKEKLFREQGELLSATIEKITNLEPLTVSKELVALYTYAHGEGFRHVLRQVKVFAPEVNLASFDIGSDMKKGRS